MAETKVENTVPIWDENNRLVHPELSRQHADAAARVLAPAKAKTAGLTPQEYQALPGQTRDIITSPVPSTDLATAPASPSGAPDRKPERPAQAPVPERPAETKEADKAS